MENKQRLIDANAIPESATAISTDGRLLVAWSAIVEAPTVDAVEVVHARWIEVRDKHNYCIGMKCNNCGRRVRNCGENYCPNCGAKMDLEG